MGAVENNIIEYWVNEIGADLGCFKNVGQTLAMINGLNEAVNLKFYAPDNKGVVAYYIADDLCGNLFVAELIFYIKREHRGDLRLFKSLIKHVEQYAKENNIKQVRWGATIGYNNDSVIKILQRWGYRPDAVVKEI